VSLPRETVSSLLQISPEIYAEKGLRTYSADYLISQMNITDPYLIALYRQFFDTEWVQPTWPSTEYHGLGIYTITQPGKNPALHSAVGLFYGVVPIENIPQEVVDNCRYRGVQPRPYYLILQIRPGNVTPETDPDSFIAIKMGSHIYAGRYNGTGFILATVQDSQLYGRVVERIISQENRRTYRGTDAWSLTEMENVFGLRRNSIVFVIGDPETPGTASASWFKIIVPELPSEGIQNQYGFFLTD
jgi:hypothetical protein